MIIDQGALNEIFPNNSLQEVVFEMRFPLNLRVMRDVCEFSEQIKREYVNMEREEIISQNALTEIKYVFQNATEDKLLVVEEYGLTLKFNQYQSFESFKTEVLEYVKLFCQLFRVDEISLIRLNYVNNIPIRLENGIASLTQYIKPCVNLELIESSSIKRFAAQVIKEKEEYLLIASSALMLEDDSNEKGIYILEFNAILNQKISLNNLPTHLTHLHDTIKEEFLENITEEYKQMMRREP